MQIPGVYENRDAQSISYVLPDPELFYQTGYKVLLGQKKNGFIPCATVMYNGKIKLSYDISRYKPLDVLLPDISQGNFITILKNLIDVVIEVKNNGFMQCENIETSPDKIFIDCNNLKAYLIYLPIDIQTGKDSYAAFEKELKSRIINAIEQCPNLASPSGHVLCERLRTPGQTIEGIRDSLKMAEGNAPGAAQPWQSAIAGPNAAQAPSQTGTGDVPEKKRRGLSGLFGPKKKAVQKPDFTPQCEGGATEVLDEYFPPEVALAGVKTPVKVWLSINKEDFVIGKNADVADGVVDFNKAISRVHCRIISENSGYFIEDLNSLNGTYVNGKKIEPHKKIRVSIGDKIRLANTDFILTSK